MKRKYYVQVCFMLLMGCCLMANGNASEHANKSNDGAYIAVSAQGQPHFTYSNQGDQDRGFFIKVNNERGCCLYKTEKPKCSMSAKTYCVKTAGKAKLEYVFHAGKSCKQIPACPKK